MYTPSSVCCVAMWSNRAGKRQRAKQDELWTGWEESNNPGVSIMKKMGWQMGKGLGWGNGTRSGKPWGKGRWVEVASPLPVNTLTMATLLSALPTMVPPPNLSSSPPSFLPTLPPPTPPPFIFRPPAVNGAMARKGRGSAVSHPTTYTKIWVDKFLYKGWGCPYPVEIPAMCHSDCHVVVPAGLKRLDYVPHRILV